MNTVKKISIALIFLLMVSPSFTAAQDRIDERQMEDMIERNLIPTIQKTEVSGTPYVSEDFTEGSFELYSGRYATGLEMNYNVYEQRIEYKTDDNETYAIDPSGIRHFTLRINGKDYTFKRGFESKRLDGDEFVKVAAEGPLSFLIKYESNFDENAGTGYGSATKQASYTMSERYYFKRGDEVSNIRRLNKRRVMRYFDGNSEVENFIDQNDLDMSDPKDVAIAVRKYNEQKE